jgi:hypothetical protein
MLSVLCYNVKGGLMGYFGWETELLKDLIPWFYVITLKGRGPFFHFLIFNS